MTCPIDNSLQERGCQIRSCMYFSLSQNNCQHGVLSSSPSEEVIREHKMVDKRTYARVLRQTQEHARSIVILDEYISYLTENHAGKVTSMSAETRSSAEDLLKDSVVVRMPKVFYLELLPLMLNEDLFDSFVEHKGVEDVSLERVLFDLPIEALKLLLKGN